MLNWGLVTKNTVASTHSSSVLFWFELQIIVFYFVFLMASNKSWLLQEKPIFLGNNVFVVTYQQSFHMEGPVIV